MMWKYISALGVCLVAAVSAAAIPSSNSNWRQVSDTEAGQLVGGGCVDFIMDFCHYYECPEATVFRPQQGGYYNQTILWTTGPCGGQSGCVMGYQTIPCDSSS
jgi:hypothetical protein